METLRLQAAKDGGTVVPDDARTTAGISMADKSLFSFAADMSLASLDSQDIERAGRDQIQQPQKGIQIELPKGGLDTIDGMEVDTEMNEIDGDSGLLPLDLGDKMEEGQNERLVEELIRLPTKGEEGTLANILNIPDRNRFVVFGGFPGILRANKDNKCGVTEVTELVENFGGTVQGTEMKGTLITR